ncbi:hypothetical protein NUSPORA_01066 [Nucleospora cyclopteri]
MIEEVFISNSSNNLVFGDFSKFPLNKLDYPMAQVFSKRICQLKVNDVILSILYRDMDNFMATKQLLNIKNCLIYNNIEITEKSVINNYFLILRLLDQPNLIFDQKKDNFSLKTDNFYLDVVEEFHSIIRYSELLNTTDVIKNSIYGEVIYKDSREIDIKIKLEPCVNFYRSSYLQQCNKEEIKLPSFSDQNQILNCSYKKGNKTILSYNVHSLEKPFINLSKNKNMFKFYTADQVKFKTLRIRIPVQETTFAAQIESRNGVAELDTKNSYVEWKFNSYEFKEESILIIPSVLEKSTDKRSILIDFLIENRNETYAKIVESKAVHNKSAKIWVKYFTQAGRYEIRLN